MSEFLERRAFLLCAAALGLAGPAAWALPAPSIITRRGDRLFVAARINGVDVEGLLDSAAETTLISPVFAARLGVGAGDKADAHGSGAATVAARLVEHVGIDAAGVEVRDATIAVIDLGDVSHRLTGRPIDAVIGREIFDAARLRIDIPGKTIRAIDTDEIPGGVELPLVDRRGIVLLPISIEGEGPVQAEFDLGNGTGVLLSRRFATQAGLFDGWPVSVTPGGGIGGPKLRQGFILRSLSVAGRDFSGVHVDVDDAPDAPMPISASVCSSTSASPPTSRATRSGWSR